MVFLGDLISVKKNKIPCAEERDQNTQFIFPRYRKAYVPETCQYKI